MTTRTTKAASPVATVTIPLTPVPASRPRVTRWGVYYGKTYKTWMAQAGDHVPPAKALAYGPLRVDMEVVCKRPQKVTRYMPRGDVDNYAKAALDLLTKQGYWPDDDEVTELFVSKRYALPGETPATHICIWNI